MERTTALSGNNVYMEAAVTAPNLCRLVNFGGLDEGIIVMPTGFPIHDGYSGNWSVEVWIVFSWQVYPRKGQSLTAPIVGDITTKN